MGLMVMPEHLQRAKGRSFRRRLRTWSLHEGSFGIFQSARRGEDSTKRDDNSGCSLR